MPICLSEAEYYYGLGSHDDYDFPTITTSRAAPDARRHASAGDVGERAPAGGI
jgi:hypothetical protein